MIAALAGAFYVLLPQLANVDDSVEALGSANWGWLAVSRRDVVLTYVASAVGMAGGVPEPLPVRAQRARRQLASSFVNRVTPANVGGMALNVRFMQKAGVAARRGRDRRRAQRRGRRRSCTSCCCSCSWPGPGRAAAGFKLPASSKLLVVIAVVLASSASCWPRRRAGGSCRTHVLRWRPRSRVTASATLARSPPKLAALFGGSVGVTLAYIVALCAAVLRLRPRRLVRRRSARSTSARRSSRPRRRRPAAWARWRRRSSPASPASAWTAGSRSPPCSATGCVTYWLPILPGWLSFHSLERHNLI